MLYIESTFGVDLTGKQQHNFIKIKARQLLKIKSLISPALDEDNYALMVSVDLSAAFDAVNIDLLMDCLRLVSLPGDVLDLIQVWLTDRYFYVEIGDFNSTLHDINCGTIQGPILYAIYISPLFDLTDLSNFADYNFILPIQKKTRCGYTNGKQT